MIYYVHNKYKYNTYHGTQYNVRGFCQYVSDYIHLLGKITERYT